jgi:hypothetical protein
LEKIFATIAYASHISVILFSLLRKGLNYMSRKQLFNLGMSFIAALFFLIFSPTKSSIAAPAAACVVSTDINWSALTCGTGGGQPTSADTVEIRDGATLTVNVNGAVASSVQVGGIGGAASQSQLAFSGATPSLTVSTNIVVGGSGNTGRTGRIITTSGSTLTASSVVMGSAGRTPAAGRINMLAGGTISAGSITVNSVTGNIWTPGVGTIQLTANNTLPATIFTNFYNLIISGGTTNLGVNTVIKGDLNIIAGTLVTNDFALALRGSFNNSGTFIAGSSIISLEGTSANPTIAGFTTTGTFRFVRTASTATLTGNVTAATLIVSGSGGTLNLGTGLSHQINGDVTLNNGTLNGGSSMLGLTGNWTKNNVTFVGGTGTVAFNGTSDQTISGSSVTPFATMSVSSGATVVVPDAPLIPTASVAVINNGRLQQTRTVNNANVSFLTISTDRYRGVDINTTSSGANLGAVTVTVRGNTGPTCTDTGALSPNYAFRCFEITPTTQGAARVTLWALTSEQNGIPTGNLGPYRFTGPLWTLLTSPTNGTGSNGYVFGQGDTTGFSAFLLGDVTLAPTAVRLNQTAVSLNASWLLLSLAGATILLLVTGWQLRSRRMKV